MGSRGSSFWADPFAGFNSEAELTNDLDPESPARDHIDALDWVRDLPNDKLAGMLFDPPYSFRQASECYKKNGREKLTATVTSKKYWSDIKNEIARKIKPGGKFIGFGWNSMGLGKNRGFVMKRVLLVPHGGSMNDTIVTVEVKK